jgi:asparagine synthase (glutamine-hydrolysing)
MCGITGAFVFSEKAQPILGRIEEATRMLQKRGPDAEGIYKHASVALGHRRLSIIDTSSAGAQPFTDQSGRYTLVLNGEFFNYKEHRQILVSQGLEFRSESDTEVLLQLWIREKEKCISKINGFFAFAIYDREDESLTIVRDRYGVKPLLYSFDTDRFLFASEMKSMLAYGISKKPDMDSLQAYFHLNYIPAPFTVFSAVRKLDPGHMAIITKGSCQLKCYYELSTAPANPAPSYAAAMETIRNLVDDAVQKRLVADVPLGAFLSGGVDSSIVTAIASEHTKKLKTFSIGFPDEPYFDETQFAEQIANRFKTDHTVFALHTSELHSHLEEALDYLDEPFADSSALLVYILSKKTKQSVTVALTGDGADELFSGYNKHDAEYRVRQGGFAENLVHSGKALWKILPKSRNTFFGNRIRQFQKFSEGMDLNEKDRYWQWAGFTQKDDVLRLFKQKPESSTFSERKTNLLIGLKGGFNNLLKTDFNLVLQNDMLVKTDMMSMANGLELRSPFLDYRLVDYVFSLPESYKITRQSKKKILKDAYRGLLPPEILDRKKHGFEVPLLKLFRKEMRQLIFDELLSDRFLLEQGFFDLNEINRLKNQLLSSDPGDSVARIWALVVFQFWWKKYGQES